MEPREFVETRTKRYMAQALEELEDRIERPLEALLVAEPIAQGELAVIVNDIQHVKATFRKKLQTLASDCLDLMPSDVQINAFEPVRRNA